MKTLNLNVKKQWFDLIQAGDKKEEYREVKQYWIERLLKSKPEDVEIDGEIRSITMPKEFDEVHFKNGFARNGKPAPSVKVECLGIEFRPNITCPLGTGDYFVIKLGEIIK